MVLKIKNKFAFPHGKGIWILINDKYDDSVIQFNQGEYFDIAWCKVVLLTNFKVVLRKRWIEERKAVFNEETHILRL